MITSVYFRTPPRDHALCNLPRSKSVTTDFNYFVGGLRCDCQLDTVVRVILEPGDATRYDFLIITTEDFIGVIKRNANTFYVEARVGIVLHPTYLIDQVAGKHVWSCFMIASLLGHVFNLDSQKFYDWTNARMMEGGV